ncbi:MAG: hypothetical protein R3F59_14225 [Myxococcota bacterium]
MLRHVSVLLMLAIATPALAGGGSADALAELREQELPSIEDTGITAFDSVFSKARAIHDTLDQVQDRIFTAQDRIALAIGLEEGTPIRMSMWELKQRAGGPIEVQMRDGKPYLTVGGTGSNEVKAMLEAVNQAAGDLAQIPNDVAQLPPQVQELVGACQQFPSQLNPNLLKEAGMNPLQLPKVAKTLGGNVKAVVATPKRLEGLVNASKDLLTGIPQGIAATEPPEEPMAIASGKHGSASEDLDDDLDAPASSKPAKAKKGGTADASMPDLPTTPIGAMVADARSEMRDAEIEHAITLLGEADSSLQRLSAPISSHELAGLYETAALLHLVDGNAAAATASVTQVLVVDPTAKPDPELGPAYAKLYKALAKSGVVATVQVDVVGSGTAYVSGHEVEGGDTVTLAAGKHLLQRQQGGQWTSELIWVAQGDSIQL